MTPEEIELRAGEFLDNLPLDLSRGQAAMLFNRLVKFAEAMQPQPEAPKKKRRMSAEERAKRGASLRAKMAADPEYRARLTARMARAHAVMVANAAARRAAREAA